MVKAETMPLMSSVMGQILLPDWITGLYVTAGVPDGAKEVTCSSSGESTSVTWNPMSATLLLVFQTLFKK